MVCHFPFCSSWTLLFLSVWVNSVYSSAPRLHVRPILTPGAPTVMDSGSSLLMELPCFEEWGEDSVKDTVEDNVASGTPRREMCARCLKPARVCLCSVLPLQKLRVPHVKVLILQHPEEAGAAKSTVALLQLCLADCRVVTGRKFKRQDLPPEVLYVCVSLSARACVCLSVCVFVSVYLSIYWSVCLSLYLFVSASASASASVSVSATVSVSISVSVSMYVCL